MSGSGSGKATTPGPSELPLSGLRVLDCATVLAGPGCARHLGDFGADVIKVERPGAGDGTRQMGWRDPVDDVTLMWKLLGRNKRTITLDLKHDDDRALLLRMVATADVLIENFRPGTLERLGLGPDVLWNVRPSLVVTRVSGFGQDGPYASRPGFATLAEAMSGFAAINGEPDGAPLLPPIALTDEITALAAAFATMVALHSASATGRGQVVDVDLLTTMFQMMGPLMGAYLTQGYLQPRLGSGIPYTVPRGTYQCSDQKWVAISTSSPSVADRVMALVGAGDDERFRTFEGRVANRTEVDELMADYCGSRTSHEVVEAFERAEAACAPVMTMADLAVDPHAIERGLIREVDGSPMPGPIARLSETPGSVRWAGRPVDADGATLRTEFTSAPPAPEDRNPHRP